MIDLLSAVWSEAFFPMKAPREVCWSRVARRPYGISGGLPAVLPIADKFELLRCILMIHRTTCSRLAHPAALHIQL